VQFSKTTLNTLNVICSLKVQMYEFKTSKNEQNYCIIYAIIVRDGFGRSGMYFLQSNLIFTENYYELEYGIIREHITNFKRVKI
jgi:hypothetical protein